MTACPSIADQALAETVARALTRWPEQAPRIERAAELLRIDAVRPLGSNRYSVRSQANATRAYLVVLTEEGGTCGCPDAQHRPAHLCKHALSCLLHEIAAQRFTVLCRRTAELVAGFTDQEVARLLFQRWRARRRLTEED